MVYVNPQRRFSLNNPWALSMIMKALLEVDGALSLDNFKDKEVDFFSLYCLKISLKNKLESNDSIVVGMLKQTLKSLGEQVKTETQTKRRMKEVIRIMDNIKREEVLLFLREFLITLAKVLSEYQSKRFQFK